MDIDSDKTSANLRVAPKYSKAARCWHEGGVRGRLGRGTASIVSAADNRTTKDLLIASRLGKRSTEASGKTLGDTDAISVEASRK